MPGRTANAVAIAGGALGASLLKVLVERGLLSADDAELVGNRAHDMFVPHLGNHDAAEGARIISEIISELLGRGVP